MPDRPEPIGFGRGPDYCPTCANERSKVYDSRASPEGWRVRRRRCDACSGRWRTFEIAEADADTMRLAFRRMEAMARLSQDLARLVKECRHFMADLPD